MSSKIKVLTDHTVNKIAAGEVIENPASVVKELVENSLDAGAKEICIEIRGGGRQLIRITDDGCGMSPDDALLSLERHATSKIREVEDIESIDTMGFRGEAIPSIASISKFMLITCQKQVDEAEDPSKGLPLGTMIVVDGGKITSCSTAPASYGTTIEIKSLFFNVPVRKKFLKSPTVDTNEILKKISSISLGYPFVKFQLISDGKTILTAPLPKNPKLEEALKLRIEAVLGPDFLEHCTPLSCELEGQRLQGMIGLPSYTRHNRTGQHLFINQRSVFSPLIAYMMKEGYGTSLPQGRHPVFVLHLSISGNLVDVNVHPQKREVRLRQEHLFKKLIFKAMEDALHNSAPSLAANENFVEPVFQRSFSLQTSSNSAPFCEAPHCEDWILNPKQLAPWNSQSSSHDQLLTQPKTTSPLFDLSHLPENLPIHLSVDTDLFKINQDAHKKKTPPNSEPHVIATIPSYIILDSIEAEGFSFSQTKEEKRKGAGGGLYLVDQKAAHARVIFEQLQDCQQGQHLAEQSLLIPYTLEVTPFERDTLLSAIPQLSRLGISLRQFGSNSFLIDSIPQIFGESDLKILIDDILNSYKGIEDDPHLSDEKNKRVAMAASRAAISSNRRLLAEEAKALINQLFLCRHPFQCPHGKPTLIHLSKDELAKLFQKSYTGF